MRALRRVRPTLSRLEVPFDGALGDPWHPELIETGTGSAEQTGDGTGVITAPDASGEETHHKVVFPGVWSDRFRLTFEYRFLSGGTPGSGDVGNAVEVWLRTWGAVTDSSLTTTHQTRPPWVVVRRHAANFVAGEDGELGFPWMTVSRSFDNLAGEARLDETLVDPAVPGDWWRFEMETTTNLVRVRTFPVSEVPPATWLEVSLPQDVRMRGQVGWSVSRPASASGAYSYEVRNVQLMPLGEPFQSSFTAAVNSWFTSATRDTSSGRNLGRWIIDHHGVYGEDVVIYHRLVGSEEGGFAVRSLSSGGVKVVDPPSALTHSPVWWRGRMYVPSAHGVWRLEPDLSWTQVYSGNINPSTLKSVPAALVWFRAGTFGANQGQMFMLTDPDGEVEQVPVPSVSGPDTQRNWAVGPNRVWVYNSGLSSISSGWFHRPLDTTSSWTGPVSGVPAEGGNDVCVTPQGALIVSAGRYRLDGTRTWYAGAVPPGLPSATIMSAVADGETGAFVATSADGVPAIWRISHAGWERVWEPPAGLDVTGYAMRLVRDELGTDEFRWVAHRAGPGTIVPGYLFRGVLA